MFQECCPKPYHNEESFVIKPNGKCYLKIIDKSNEYLNTFWLFHHSQEYNVTKKVIVYMASSVPSKFLNSQKVKISANQN